MSEWRGTKARRVLSALLRIGWQVKRERGLHRVLDREGWADVVFAFHEGEELGPRMLARIAKHTGLRPEDLYYSDQNHKPPNYTLHLTAGASGPARTFGPRPPAAGERGRQADRDAEGAAE